MGDLRGWWAEGERVRLPLGGTEREVFLLRRGTGPAMTMLHGFPSSSHDWAKVMPALSAAHDVLAPDFLGFGATDKPPEHRYSLLEQADLIEALWASVGVEETVLVAHDYGVSVAQGSSQRSCSSQGCDRPSPRAMTRAPTARTSGRRRAAVAGSGSGTC